MSPTSPTIRRRRERVAFHYKVDELLTPADLTAYLSLIEHPRTRVDDAHAWLTARGYALSRSAVARHRCRHLNRLAESRRTIDAARAVGEAVAAGASGGTDAVSFDDAAGVYLAYLLFDRLLSIDKDSPPPPKEMLLYAQAISQNIRSRLDANSLADLRERATRRKGRKGRGRRHGREVEDDERPPRTMEERIVRLQRRMSEALGREVPIEMVRRGFEGPQGTQADPVDDAAEPAQDER